MTMPHLHNCSHDENGWCLDCVSELGNQHEILRDRVKEAIDMLVEIQTYVSCQGLAEEVEQVLRKGLDYVQDT